VSRLAEACGVLEQLGAAGSLAEAPPALERLGQEYPSARDALRAMARRPGP
jgi:hypothetical protein